MAKRKVDEITLMREKALDSGKVVVTKKSIDHKLRMQLLKNYGLVVKKNAS
jgi:hypothetical protein